MLATRGEAGFLTLAPLVFRERLSTGAIMSSLRPSLFVLLAAVGSLLAQEIPGQAPVQNMVQTVIGCNPTGIPATSFSLNSITALATDPSGDIFFAENGRNQVYRIAPDGVLTIFAGNGFWGEARNGAPAASSPIAGSVSLAVDGAGNLVIRDTSSVFRVDSATGIITVLFTYPYWNAGASIAAISQFVAAPNGNYYIADNADQRIEVFNPSTGGITVLAGNGTTGEATPGVLAVNSPFSYPNAIALGPDGAVYFSDEEPFVFRIDPQSGILSAVDVSNGTGSDYAIPYSLAVDAGGDVFAALPNESQVIMIPAGSSTPEVLGGTGSQVYSGDGPFNSGSALPSPTSVAVDAAGNLLVGSTLNPRLLRIDLQADLMTTIAGNGLLSYEGDGHLATAVQLFEPADVLPVQDGGFLVTSSFAGRILRVLPDGSVVSVAGGGSPTQPFGVPVPASQASLYVPQGMWGSPYDELFFSYSDNFVLGRWRAATGIVDAFSESPKTFSSGSGQLFHSAALIASGDSFYLSDPDNHTVWRIPKSTGAFSRFAGAGVQSSSGDGGPAASAAISMPSGLASDLAGDIYIAEAGSDLGPSVGKIRRVQAGSGTITTVLDGLAEPDGLAFDPDGRLCFSETGANRVSCLNLQSGAVEVIAGTGVAGFSGDGGPALDAQFYRPLGIAFDQFGDLYVADTGNQRVRLVRFQAPPGQSLIHERPLPSPLNR